MTCLPASERRNANRTLAVSGLLHALHDGYTDLIYVLLPIWQAEFGLSYSLLAVLRGLYAGSMAALQVPAGRLAERMDGRVVLAAGTILAAVGYLLAGSVVIEQIFQLQGLGSYTLQAIQNKDFIVVQSVVLALAAIVVATSLVVDIAYAWLNPKVRLS